MARTGNAQGGIRILSDPTWVQKLFSTTEYAWLWLIARVYLGWLWLDAGWSKMQNEAWMSGGMAVRGSWERMTAVPEGGSSPIAYDWYRQALLFMLDNGWYTVLGPVIAVGEWLVGLALIVGAFTGIAALAGGFMNWNFAMAGMGPGSNAVMIIIAIGLVLAWKTAGWWGLDRWLLPALGTPWQTGRVFGGPWAAPSGGPPRQHPVEQWVRIGIGAGVAILALANLEGLAQVVVLLLAAALVAVTGLGWLSILRPSSSGAAQGSPAER